MAMVKKLRVDAADLRGVSRLTIDGVAGVVALVEAMHYNIGSVPGILTKPKRDRTTGITRLVYRIIRGGIGVAGPGLDGLLADSSLCSASEVSGRGARRCSRR